MQTDYTHNNIDMSIVINSFVDYIKYINALDNFLCELRVEICISIKNNELENQPNGTSKMTNLKIVKMGDFRCACELVF